MEKRTIGFTAALGTILTNYRKGFSKEESLDSEFPEGTISFWLQFCKWYKIDSNCFFLQGHICVGIETATPLSFEHSLGPQETLHPHVCGLAMKDQWPGRLQGQEMFF